MQNPAPFHFSVASYNIRAGLGTDLRRRAHRTIGVIESLEADIVVLQEADFRLGPRPSSLDRACFGTHCAYVSVPVRQNDVSIGWHGNAILVRPATVIEAVYQLDLPGLEPRGAIAADLRIGAQLLRIVGVHLGLLRSSRRKQLYSIRRQLADLPPRPTVIAGDFNEWAQTRGLEPLENGYEVHTPGRSYPAGRPLLRFDRMATTPDLAIQAAGVVQSGEARRASDHLPIWARFSGAGS